MSKIFLSHSSANNAEALAVAQWLEARGWSDYFLAINPVRGISAGERWQEALKAAAHRCEAVVFLISRPWLDSKWCVAEFLLAKNLGKNIFGVLIEEIALSELPKEMTGEYQLCDLVSGEQREAFTVESDPLVPLKEVSLASAGLENLRIGLQDAGLGASSFPWPPENDPERSPYRGLKPLQLEDAAVYFGRDAPIVRGLDELRKLRETRAAAAMVVLGASGCGKSSFLRAGLWPRLKRDDRHFIPLPVVRPARGVVSGDHGLAASLETAFGDFGISKTRGEIQATTREIDGIDRLLLELRAAASAQRESSERTPSLVLGIDQGEELYMSEGDEESQQVRQWLAATIAKNGTNIADTPHVIPIITIRTDLYESLQTDELLAGIEQRIFGLKPIDRTEYREIIEGPAQRATEAGNLLDFDPKLTERLLEDTKGADALPLLAFTLERLFVDYGSDGDLRLDEYETSGGVKGALEAAVGAALEVPQDFPAIPANRDEQEKLLRAAFIPWLAEIDEQTEERRRRQADWEEIPIESRPIVERLVEARLLLMDQTNSGKMIIEVAHEALLRRWPALVRWLDADSDVLRVAAAVMRSADAWNANNRNLEWLDHAGERLTEAESILQRPDLHRRLGTGGRDYLAECRRSENESAKKERQQAAKQRKLLIRYQTLRVKSRLEEAKRKESELYPAWPERRKALDEWLRTTGQPLAEKLPRLQRELEELRTEHATRVRDSSSFVTSEEKNATEDELATVQVSLPQLKKETHSRSTWSFADEDNQFIHDTLALLVTELREFAAGNHSTLVRVRERIEWASRVERLSISDHEELWQQARWSIIKADGENASELYGKHPIELDPQIGLVPIGINPHTRLWEFYHLRSAVDPSMIPEYDKEARIEVAEHTGIVFVLIPGGTFMMGAQKDCEADANYYELAQPDEMPHEVRVKPYFLARHQMTQAQWKRLSGGEEPSFYREGQDISGDRRPIDLRLPVEQVSWTMCQQLLAHHGLALPTEGQWEYGCRAGTEMPWSTGWKAKTLSGFANIADKTTKGARVYWDSEESVVSEHVDTAPVGSYKANQFGLHDVHGNVWEWCQDSYHPEYEAPEGGTSSTRVYRGGSFRNVAEYARSALRHYSAPSNRTSFLGLRPARKIKAAR